MPIPPNQWLKRRKLDNDEDLSRLSVLNIPHSCNRGWIRIAWPKYPSSLEPVDGRPWRNSTTVQSYTAPVRNYSLQYVRLSQFTTLADLITLRELADTVGPQDFRRSDWVSYEPSPQLGHEADFPVLGWVPFNCGSEIRNSSAQLLQWMYIWLLLCFRETTRSTVALNYSNSYKVRTRKTPSFFDRLRGWSG